MRFLGRAAVLFTTCLAALAILGVAGWGVNKVVRAVFPSSAAVPVDALGLGPAPALQPVALVVATPSSIPVLVYHQIDTGCAPLAAQCNSTEVETSSEKQFGENLNWLYRQGYRTITMSQYVLWTEGKPEELPAKPVLLTADNGIEGFLTAATPLLQRYGFTMTAMVVTGFANAATTDQCAPPSIHAGAKVVSVQPACPAGNVNWDATWAQLKALPSRTWGFALEAGTAGHYVQDYDQSCRVFLACAEPGETAAHYERRVTAELGNGEQLMSKELGSRSSGSVWTVPYSDLGYKRCVQDDCTPQPYDGPHGWLTGNAAGRFAVVFVEDAFRNGIQHERFRFDVQGWMTQKDFQSLFTSELAAGDFRR